MNKWWSGLGRRRPDAGAAGSTADAPATDTNWLAWPARVHAERALFRAEPQDLLLVETLRDPARWLVVLDIDGYRELLLPMLARARRGALRASGFRFGELGASRSGRFDYRTPGGGRGFAITIEDAPQDHHRALLWSQPHRPGGRLWVDGTEVRVTGQTPLGVIDAHGWWADERFFVARVDGPGQPGDRAAIHSELGPVQGLLIVDAGRGRHEVVLPSASERWPLPVLGRVGGRWHVWRDGGALRAGAAPDRVLDVPR